MQAKQDFAIGFRDLIELNPERDTLKILLNVC